jgi:hypothetical protein
VIRRCLGPSTAITVLMVQNPDLADRPRFWIGAYVIPEEFIDRVVAGLIKAGLKAPVTG